LRDAVLAMAERMRRWEVDRLKLLIRKMTRHSKVYKVLRDELRLIGHWKNRPRGKRWEG